VHLPHLDSFPTRRSSDLAVLAVGAMPVFADVELETFQIDPTQVACKITPRTKAILAVHIAGVAVDMDRIMELAKRQDLIVIEDRSEEHTSELQSRENLVC